MSDNDLLRRYLLGELPEGEERSMEERLLRDDELSELAEATESEILEDYARGSLSPAQRRRVETFLASSPSGRLRLAVVQGLSKLAAQPDNVLPFRRPDLSRPAHRFAAIAAMLAIAAASLMLIPLRRDLPEQAAAIASPPQAQAPEIPGRTPTAQQPGPGVIAQNPAATTPTPAPLAPPAPPAPSLAPAVIQLALSTLRTVEGQEPPVLTFPTDRSAELQVLLGKTHAGYASYEVVVEDSTGEVAFRWEDLLPKTIDGRQALVLPIQAGEIRDGRYTARVLGSSGTTNEDVAFQEFQVRQP